MGLSERALEALQQNLAKAKNMAKGSGRRKYHNVPTVVDGHRFDSKREATRYRELCLLQQAGQIHDLELQPKYILLGANGEPLVSDKGRKLTYTADFRYYDVELQTQVVEDVKGRPNDRWPLKKAIMRSMGVDVREV